MLYSKFSSMVINVSFDYCYLNFSLINRHISTQKVMSVIETKYLGIYLQNHLWKSAVVCLRAVHRAGHQVEGVRAKRREVSLSLSHAPRYSQGSSSLSLARHTNTRRRLCQPILFTDNDVTSYEQPNSDINRYL